MTGLAGLAPILKTEAVVVVKMVGYFDESEDIDSAVLSIAGVFGKADDWVDLERAWDDLLDDRCLSEFKMSDSEKGRHEWRGIIQEERWEGQRPFIELFSRNPNPSPIAVAVSVDLTSLPSPSRRKRPTADAWLEAFRVVLAQMIIAQDMFGLTGERLALVFDVKDGVKGRATEIWDRMKADPIFGHHLGSLTFTDSKLTPSLQMADMLAYEGRRILERIKQGRPPTWQWTELAGATLPHVGGPRLHCQVLEDRKVGFVDVQERLGLLLDPGNTP